MSPARWLRLEDARKLTRILTQRGPSATFEELLLLCVIHYRAAGSPPVSLLVSVLRSTWSCSRTSYAGGTLPFSLPISPTYFSLLFLLADKWRVER